jgi:hypothetical protein
LLRLDAPRQVRKVFSEAIWRPQRRGEGAAVGNNPGGSSGQVNCWRLVETVRARIDKRDMPGVAAEKLIYCERR